MVNARVQISCVIEEGDPPLTIRWFRNGRPLHAQSSSSSIPSASSALLMQPPAALPAGPLPAGLRVIDFNAYSSILSVDHVTLSHGGNYSCLAENAAGIAVHAALLQVSGTLRYAQPSSLLDVLCPVLFFFSFLIIFSSFHFSFPFVPFVIFWPVCSLQSERLLCSPRENAAPFFSFSLTNKRIN